VRRSALQCPMAVVRVRVQASAVAVVAVAAAVAVAVDLVETRRNGVARRYRANGGKHPDSPNMFVGASRNRDRRLW
jgi:hypothetical protein